MTKKPTIIITGASGLVGTELVTYFSQKGWHVRALVRDPKHQPQKTNVLYFAYDMTNDPDPTIFKRADYLVHAAYIAQSKAYPDPYAINVEAAKKLLSLSRKNNLQRNIFLSSMSVQKEATSSYSKQKAAIELLFNRPVDTVVRSGLILGNGGLAQRIANFMRSKHMAPLISGGDQPIQVIGVYDLARVIEAVFAKNVSGRLNIGTPDVYSYREFYLMLREKRQLSAILVPVPFFAPLLAIRFVNLLRLPLGITEDNLQGLRHLKPYETLADLKRVDIHIDPLDVILDKVAL